MPTIRKTGRAKADGQAAPPSSLDGASSVPPIHADETIVKPFSDVELLSYVHALESGGATDETTLIHGDLMLDTRNRQAFYRSGKQPLALSAREYTTLETLIRANGEFLSFDELLEKVCGTGIFEQRDIMDGTLYSLTRKMRRMGFFITQRGIVTASADIKPSPVLRRRSAAGRSRQRCTKAGIERQEKGAVRACIAEPRLSGHMPVIGSRRRPAPVDGQSLSMVLPAVAPEDRSWISVISSTGMAAASWCPSPRRP